MCGRFTLRTPASLLVSHFQLNAPPLWEPRYNIAPTQIVATIVGGPGASREFVPRRWGLVPSWADDASIGNRLINARAETVADKPAFRSAFKRHRCLVPADGYYEWQAGSKPKQPYLIRFVGDELFAFAGLWEVWQAPDGSVLSTCTLITTDASPSTRAIHDRMPVILAETDYVLWLDEQIASRDRLLPLLKPCDDPRLEALPVSTFVNNPRHEGPQCVAPPT